ncbi:glycosyltransferase [Enorma phocaeensis]|uniref:glycosyltransferase n=1 Tax=Enorma phocaeensis TaxID=1871019 RepID=UPI001955FEAB|nr:glycosyltransferase [Enorma phocaeensis]MBM6953482.1 glycosyltransferase [Enorma phocaeensis]
MKAVVIVSSLFAGGAERVSLELSRFLAEKGNEVHLFVARVSKRYPATYIVPPNVHLHYVPFGTDGNLTRPLLNAVLLKRLTNKVNPDWIISLGMQYKLLKTTGLLGSRKVLLSERNYPPKFYEEKELDFVSKCYELATMVVFQTKEAADCFPNVDPSKKKIIPNAARVSSNRWTGLASKHIAFMGRLTRQKNPEMLIEAFVFFSRNHPNYHLDIFGDGELRKGLETLVEKRGLSAAVSFHGQCSDAVERAAKCLMYVSTSDYEGISNSMLEAMSLGMPCVCTDCAGGGARSVITDQINGILVPCRDPDYLASAMARVADSEELANGIGRAARESMARFSAELIFKEWLKVLS